MTFDNQKRSYRIYLRKLSLAIFFVILAAILVTTKWFDNRIYDLSQFVLAAIVAGIYLLISLINYIRELNYFYFNDNAQNIVVRYYPLRPMSKNRRSVEIPKTAFAGFEIRKELMGLKKVLILKQVIKKKVAKYPPISITSLTREELDMLIRQLSSYSRGS